MRLEDRGQHLWSTITADLQRYAGKNCRPWSLTFFRNLVKAGYEHPGLFAVVIYRYGQWIEFRCKIPIFKQILDAYYYYLYNWVRTRWQIEVPRTSSIDAGFKIEHFGGILINSQIIAGRNLTITAGVIVGQTDTGVPVLEDDIHVGVGVKIIGGIHIGNRVIIGAQSLVNKDVPDDVTIAGVPARIIRHHTQTQNKSDNPSSE
jgi:serine O-acetyltransferase